MKAKILFLHGFYASGQCVPAMALRNAFEGNVEVLTPDLPIHPKEAVGYIRGLIDKEKPDTLAHFEPLFLQYYSHSFHFPGGHTPTAEEVQQYYVPLIKKMLTTNLCNQ